MSIVDVLGLMAGALWVGLIILAVIGIACIVWGDE